MIWSGKNLLWIVLLFCFSTGHAFAQQDANSTGGQLTADDLFRNDHVIDIQVEIAKEDWDTVRMQSRNFVESLGKELPDRPFTYARANVTIDGVRIEDVGIRKKGFLGSLDETRPSLKIKFSEYTDQDPVAGLDRLTLNNNKQDPSRLSQYMTYKLYRESGTRAPRCGFAKVTVNGEYLGIYSNVETVKAPFLKREFGDASGALYEGTVVDFYLDWIQKFEKKNKSAEVRHVKQVAELLTAEELDLDELEKVLDIDAFIRFWAMESLLGFWDGYCNNQNNYFVYDNPVNGKFYFIPWGTDSAYTKTMPLPPYRVRPRSVHCQAILPNRLYRIPETQERYVNTFMSMLEENWQEDKLLAEIDRVETLLSDHVLDSNKQFSRSVKNVERFVKTRRKDLMSEFEDGPPELPARHRSPIQFVEIGKARITFATKWYDQTPRRSGGLGDVTIDLELFGESVELENVGAFAELSKWPNPGGEQPPSIVFVGNRKSDGKRLTLGTGLSKILFQPTGEPSEIGGIFMEGASFMNEEGQMRMIGGQATFTAASMTDGEPVSGTMQLSIVEMQGGKPVPDSD